jgi:hypothetical protein
MCTAAYREALIRALTAPEPSPPPPAPGQSREPDKQDIRDGTAAETSPAMTRAPA